MGERLSEFESASDAQTPMRKFVRVTGARLGRYVEFEFIINDETLTVELILPLEAFDEFCRLQNATILPAREGAAEQMRQLAWRARQPGLLRRVMGASEDEDAPRSP